MEKPMRIFTVDGKAILGAVVEKLKLTGADVEIPAIIIGETGRGRERGVLPVHLLPASMDRWREDGSVVITSAKLGTTKAGKPKLFETETASADASHFIAVLRTHVGFRGGNEHTGDIVGELKKDEYGNEYAAWPGKNLVTGYVAQGAAGRAGGGAHLISLLPKDTVFRTSYRGRLYGNPSGHFFKWVDGNLVCATPEERFAADLF